MKRRVLSGFLALLCIISSLSLAGCKNNANANKNLIYFLNFKPESAKVYEELAKKYEEENSELDSEELTILLTKVYSVL